MNVLDQLDQLEREATAPPWKAQPSMPYRTVTAGPLTILELAYQSASFEHRDDADANLIAFSRTHLRALLNAAKFLKRLREWDALNPPPDPPPAPFGDLPWFMAELDRALAPLLEEQ